MKKAILCIFFTLVALGAGAQTLPPFSELLELGAEYDRKSGSGRDHFSFSMYEYFGVGFHGLLSADAAFADNTVFFRSNEIFFNLFGLSFRPGSEDRHLFWLGVDLNWDNYRLDTNHLWVPSDKSVGVAALSEVGMKSVKRSVLRVLSLDIPLDYTLSFGDFHMTVGGAAELNLPGRTRFIGVDVSDSEIRNTKSGPFRATDIKTNPLTWNAFAQLRYGSFGVYAKYAPQPVFVQGFGPQFSTWTVGLILR